MLLPNEILAEILSFLPLEECIEKSIRYRIFRTVYLKDFQKELDNFLTKEMLTTFQKE